MGTSLAAEAKASKKLALVTEANLIRDGFAGCYTSTTDTPGSANAFGLAQYVSYAMNDTITLNRRVEADRYDNNFFVASVPNNRSFVSAEQGFTLGVGAPYPTT